MAALFEITAEILEAYEKLVDSDGEVSAENEEALAALSQIEAGKLESFYWCIRKAETEEATAKAMAEQFAKKAKARAKAAEWMKEQVKAHLEATGQQKVTTASGNTFAVQKNGGKRPVVLTDGISVPERFIRTKIETSPDFDAIRSALDAEDPEAQKVAAYGEPGFHLRLR